MVYNTKKIRIPEAQAKLPASYKKSVRHNKVE